MGLLSPLLPLWEAGEAANGGKADRWDLCSCGAELNAESPPCGRGARHAGRGLRQQRTGVGRRARRTGRGLLRPWQAPAWLGFPRSRRVPEGGPVSDARYPVSSQTPRWAARLRNTHHTPTSAGACTHVHCSLAHCDREAESGAGSGAESGAEPVGGHSPRNLVKETIFPTRKTTECFGLCACLLYERILLGPFFHRTFKMSLRPQSFVEL